MINKRTRWNLRLRRRGSRRLAGGGQRYRRLAVEAAEERMLLSAAPLADLVSSAFDVQAAAELKREVVAVFVGPPGGGFGNPTQLGEWLASSTIGRRTWDGGATVVHGPSLSPASVSSRALVVVAPILDSTVPDNGFLGKDDRLRLDPSTDRLVAVLAQDELMGRSGELWFDDAWSVLGEDAVPSGTPRVDGFTPRDLDVAPVPTNSLNAEGRTDRVAVRWIGFRATADVEPAHPDAREPAWAAIGLLTGRVAEPAGSPTEGHASAATTSDPVEFVAVDAALVETTSWDAATRFVPVSSIGFPLETIRSPTELPSAVSPVDRTEGGFIELESRGANVGEAIPSMRLNALTIAEGTSRGAEENDADASTRGAGVPADAPAPSRTLAMPSAASSEKELALTEDREEPGEAADALEYQKASEKNVEAPPETRLTAIAAADLDVHDEEGGFIDLTCVVNEPVRLACNAIPTADGLVDGRGSPEALALDASRGRSQAFELAMAAAAGETAALPEGPAQRPVPGSGSPTASPLNWPDSKPPEPAPSLDTAVLESGAPAPRRSEAASTKEVEAGRANAAAVAHEQNRWSAGVTWIVGLALMNLIAVEPVAGDRRPGTATR